MPKYFHYTRLLPDEVKDVQEQGLRPASCELLLSKLRAAKLTREELEVVQKQHAAREVETQRSNPSSKLFSGLLTFFDREQRFEVVDRFFGGWGGGELLTDAPLRPGLPAPELLRSSLTKESDAYTIIVETDRLKVDSQRTDESWTTDSQKIEKIILMKPDSSRGSLRWLPAS